MADEPYSGTLLEQVDTAEPAFARAEIGALEEFGFPAHAHHWIIGGQHGPVSAGVCKFCDAQRDFTNGFRRSYQGPSGPGRRLPDPI
jgi:hypothetical protein